MQAWLDSYTGQKIWTITYDGSAESILALQRMSNNKDLQPDNDGKLIVDMSNRYPKLEYVFRPGNILIIHITGNMDWEPNETELVKRNFTKINDEKGAFINIYKEDDQIVVSPTRKVSCNVNYVTLGEAIVNIDISPSNHKNTHREYITTIKLPI